jgi:hypothetical protein
VIDAYRNLRRRCISVRRKGRVVKCSKSVSIKNPKFIVQAAGRKRVLREQQKNVHAFVRGEPAGRAPRGLCTVAVTYDPYKYKSFVTRKGKRPIRGALFAVVKPSGVLAYRKC